MCDVINTEDERGLMAVPVCMFLTVRTSQGMAGVEQNNATTHDQENRIFSALIDDLAH